VTREDFMQLCERAADFCDVCKTCTITFTKPDGNVISLTANDKPLRKEGSALELRELH
jgi:hypothetical protein